MGRGIRFATEFKREAVRLALTSGRPRAEIAEDLEVDLSSLTRWVDQYRGEEIAPEITDDLQAELKWLRKVCSPWSASSATFALNSAEYRVRLPISGSLPS